LFVDTGANVNTMSRSQHIAFLDANADFDYVEGLFGGLEVKLVGGKTLHVAGDKVRIQTEVTTMGKVRGVEEFLVLDNDAEDIYGYGVHWYQSESDEWWVK